MVELSICQQSHKLCLNDGSGGEDQDGGSAQLDVLSDITEGVFADCMVAQKQERRFVDPANCGYIANRIGKLQVE